MDSHSSTQALEDYVSGKLSADDSSLVQSHLDKCEECQHRLVEIALDVQWKGVERRKEPRVPVRFPGRLKLLDPITSVSPPHEVEVVEISRSGFKIRTDRYLIPKTLVQVRFNGRAVLGEVRYCIRTDAGYQAGLERRQDFPS
jgi:hypothetical protein